MRKMKGMIRWMANHHFTVNFMHLARHAPKGRVATKVMARRVARRRGLCEENSMREYVAEGRGMVKEGGANTTGHGDTVTRRRGEKADTST